MESRDASAVRPLVAVTIILALSASSSSSGRKELQGKEINMVTSNWMDKPLHPDRVDPSRVVQVSWHPRSGRYIFLDAGFSCTRVFYPTRSVIILFFWLMVSETRM